MSHIDGLIIVNLTKIEPRAAGEHGVSLHDRDIIIIFEVPNQLSLLAFQIKPDLDNLTAIIIIKVNKKCIKLVQMQFKITPIIIQPNLKHLPGIPIRQYPININPIINVQDKQVGGLNGDVLGEYVEGVEF